jgi:hypothetical protein
MINIEIACGGPRSAVVRAEPGPGGRRARRVLDDVCAVAREDDLARVALAALRDPVREQIARVARLRALCSYFKA